MEYSCDSNWSCAANRRNGWKVLQYNGTLTNLLKNSMISLHQVQNWLLLLTRPMFLRTFEKQVEETECKKRFEDVKFLWPWFQISVVVVIVGIMTNFSNSVTLVYTCKSSAVVSCGRITAWWHFPTELPLACDGPVITKAFLNPHFQQSFFV